MSEEPSDFRYSQKALDENEYAESAAITLFPTGTSLMPVTAGANWGLNTGEAGLITTKSTGVEGVQTFEAYNGSEYKRSYTSGVWAAWAEVGAAGGGGDLTLGLDEFVETDPLTDFPDGISIMPISDDPSWAEWGVEERVVTNRVGTEGSQILTFAGESETLGIRIWNSSSTEWYDWWFPISDTHIHAALLFQGDDTRTEADLLTNHQSGFSLFLVSAGANWGPNTGEAGVVETCRAGSNGTQTFTQFSNGNKFSRGYSSGAWSAWVALQ